ncbi:MAG: c-type cytochrome [Myxococcota bacterium]|nr:c-type cytochrome [Myxococcota bacterium]
MKKRLDHGFGTPTSFSRAHDCEFEPSVRGTSSRRKRAVTAANRKNDPQPSADARGQRRNFGDRQSAVGSRQYSELCARCHGTAAVAGGDITDLRHLPTASHARFDEIVRGGLCESVGMPRFDAELNREQADAIHAYIIEQAHEDLQAKEGNSVWRSIKQGLHSALAWILF